MVDLIAKLDKDGNKLIDFREFADGLRALGINVTHQEQHALMRRFDLNGDGMISMEEFYNGLSKEF